MSERDKERNEGKKERVNKGKKHSSIEAEKEKGEKGRKREKGEKWHTQIQCQCFVVWI
jgi:hypothetical protein